MPMNVWSRMWRDHYSMLFGQMSDTQGFSETGVAVASNCIKRIAPEVMKSRMVKQVHSRSPCAKGWKSRRRADVIRRLQVPVQGLLEPEDVIGSTAWANLTQSCTS
jgi:hypothetical protein